MLPNFLKYVLAVCLILGTGFESLADPHGKVKVETVALYLPVEVKVPMSWVSCDSWNGAYYFSGYITLCKENLDEGLEVARFIYLHELGHAYTFSRDLTYERWGDNYEASADEFAAIMSIVQGHPEDLLEMAELFEELEGWEEGDPHPPGAVRAQKLRDIYLGAMYPWTPYHKTFRDALFFWRHTFLEHP